MKDEQLQRLRNLNISLLETLIETCHFIEGYTNKYDIPFPSEHKFSCLIQQARQLIKEINEEIPRLNITFKSRKLPPFNFDDENPDKLPESVSTKMEQQLNPRQAPTLFESSSLYYST